MELSILPERGQVSPRRLEWDELLRKGRGAELPAIDGLKGNSRVEAVSKSWVAAWARRFPDSVVFQTLSAAPFDEILGLWADQVGKDLRREESAVGFERPFKAGLLRRHHQLLCTPASLVRRFERVRAECGPKDKILLVGDDDQLSLLLAREGYRNVTVIDIDAALIDRLREHGRGRLRAAVHDLNEPAPENLRDDYDLIVMDPPYSVSGIDLFLEGALTFMSSSRRPRVHLYVASVCLLRAGLAEVQNGFFRRGFAVEEVVPGLCGYPYPRVARWAFQGLYALVALRLGMFREFFVPAMIPKTISSDLWILHPRL